MNDVIAALEWALDEARHRADCSQVISEVKELDKHARTIRAHIADLQARRLVRREDVVAEERAKVVAYIHSLGSGLLAMLPNTRRTLADGIAAGAHGGGDE